MSCMETAEGCLSAIHDAMAKDKSEGEKAPTAAAVTNDRSGWRSIAAIPSAYSGIDTGRNSSDLALMKVSGDVGFANEPALPEPLRLADPMAVLGRFIGMAADDVTKQEVIRAVFDAYGPDVEVAFGADEIKLHRNVRSTGKPLVPLIAVL